MSTWTQRRENAQAAVRAARVPSPDELDDRQVDAIDAAHQLLDSWCALPDPIPADYRLFRASLPARSDGGAHRCDRCAPPPA